MRDTQEQLKRDLLSGKEAFVMTQTTTLQIKIGLYTPKDQWLTTDLSAVAPLIAQHIDEPTGIYLPLSVNTGEKDAYRFQPLWDFDDKLSPTRALDDARHFVSEHLIKKGIPLDALIPFASGRKGIHIASRHLLPPPPPFQGGD